jgi:hypothetical protein
LDRYRFRYVPGKTARSVPQPLNLLLVPFYTPFIDALILGDLPARYLPALREKALADRRPLYVRYDNMPCPTTSYGRAWAKEAGTGGHIARTLAYDEFAAGVDEGEDPDGRASSPEFAVAYGKLVNHHVSERTPRKYRSEIAIRREVEAGQQTLAARALRLGPPEDDD